MLFPEDKDPTSQPPIDSSSPEASTEHRERKTRALFINDNADLLRSLGRAFSDLPGVVMAECHSVEEALTAIETHKPAIVFLDHQLTEGGQEGFEILEKVQGRGMTIYSTTANTHAAQEYERLGVRHIQGSDLKGLRSVLELE